MSVRNPWEIPRKWRDRICTCKGIKAETSDGFLRCAKCHRPYDYQFFKCGDCESFFICDFKWPYFCVWHPTCWNCSQDHTSICNEKHGWTPTEEYLNMEVRAPRGLNPKAYTAEELAGVFDFD